MWGGAGRGKALLGEAVWAVWGRGKVGCPDHRGETRLGIDIYNVGLGHHDPICASLPSLFSTPRYNN